MAYIDIQARRGLTFIVQGGQKAVATGGTLAQEASRLIDKWGYIWESGSLIPGG